MYFTGWYLNRNNQLALSNSNVSYEKNLTFYDSKDAYGASLDFVAKYSLTASSSTITTKKTVELIDETTANSKTIEYSLIRDKDFIQTNHILDYDGKYYLFTGWWQVVADSTRPATYILVSNSFNDDLPNVTQLVARFVRLKDIVVNLPQDHSGYMFADMYYRYYYTQASQLNDVRIRNYTATASKSKESESSTYLDDTDLATVQYVFSVPVDTYMNNVKIYSAGGTLGGFYFGNPNDSTSNITGAPVSEDKTAYTVINDLDNLIGVRYNVKTIEYVNINSTIYYIKNGKLYGDIVRNNDLYLKLDSTRSVQFDIPNPTIPGASSYEITENQVKVMFNKNGTSLPLYYNISSADYVIHDYIKNVDPTKAKYNIYFIKGSSLYTSLNFEEKDNGGNYKNLLVNGMESNVYSLNVASLGNSAKEFTLHYTIFNNVVVFNEREGTPNKLSFGIPEVYKVGY